MSDVAAAIIGALIGWCVVLAWALWPVIVDIARHGWHNDR